MRPAGDAAECRRVERLRPPAGWGHGGEQRDSGRSPGHPAATAHQVRVCVCVCTLAFHHLGGPVPDGTATL